MGGRPTNDIATKLDKAYEGKSIADLADAPVSALQGVSDGDAEQLKSAFGISTVRDLGTNKYFQLAGDHADARRVAAG